MNEKEYLDKLDKLEEEELNKIKKEEKTESEINNAIIDTVSKLIQSDKCIVDFDNTKYFIKFSVYNTGKFINKGNTQYPEKMMVLVASNITKAEIAKGRYIPMTLKIEFNRELTFKGNLTVLVEAFIRHITGKIKPEMLGEDSTYMVGKKNNE